MLQHTLTGTNQLLHDVISVELGRIMNGGIPICVPLVQQVNLAFSVEMIDVGINSIGTIVSGSLATK